jgi:DHA1 family bicyclomycin/chloramphenicol resistance-like MFS transporter
LLLARLVQGMGAGCGPVLAFAIVRDSFEGAAARVKLSAVTMTLSVAPIVAPTLGGFMLQAGGWRGIYLVLGATGLALAVAVALGLRETRPGGRTHGHILSSYARVLRERRSMSYVAVNALTFAGLFAFIGGSPLVLIGSMGVSVATFGALFATAACGLILGAWVNGRLAARGVPPHRPLWLGLWLALGAAVVPSVLHLAGWLTPGTLIVFMVAATTCRGLVNPNAVHGAMERLPEIAGAVSAVLGCAQTIAAAASGAVVALLHPVLGPLAMTGTMTVATAGAIATMLLTARWRR